MRACIYSYVLWMVSLVVVRWPNNKNNHPFRYINLTNLVHLFGRSFNIMLMNCSLFSVFIDFSGERPYVRVYSVVFHWVIIRSNRCSKSLTIKPVVLEKFLISCPQSQQTLLMGNSTIWNKINKWVRMNLCRFQFSYPNFFHSQLLLRWWSIKTFQLIWRIRLCMRSNGVVREPCAARRTILYQINYKICLMTDGSLLCWSFSEQASKPASRKPYNERSPLRTNRGDNFDRVHSAHTNNLEFYSLIDFRYW